MDNWLEIMGLGGQRWATAGSLPCVLFDAVYLPRLYQTLPPLVVQKWRRQAVSLTVRHRCGANIYVLPRVNISSERLQLRVLCRHYPNYPNNASLTSILCFGLLLRDKLTH